MENQPEVHKFKLLFLGNSTVGKTSILQRYIDEVFHDKFVATIGIDHRVKYVEMDNMKYKLEIWDTAGQERFQAIARNYMRGGHGFIFVYAVNDRKSFTAIKKWIKEANKNETIKSYQMVIIGNKCDLVNESDEKRDKNNEVTLSELKSLGEEYGVNCYESSAKMDINIKYTFELLVKELILHKDELIMDTNNSNIMFKEGVTQLKEIDINNNSKESSLCGC